MSIGRRSVASLAAWAYAAALNWEARYSALPRVSCYARPRMLEATPQSPSRSALAARTARLIARAMLRRAAKGPLHPNWPISYELTMAVLRAVIEVDHRGAARAQRTRESFVPPRLWSKVRVHETWLAGIRCQVHTPVACAPEAATVLYLHGGGYVSCSPNSHKHLIAALAHAAGVRVVAPFYRLAPEHPFPAALLDALTCYRTLLTQFSQGPARIVVAGDSAGGGLSVALALKARAEELPMPRALVLFSPWVDLSVSLADWQTHAEHDYLRPQMLADAAALYAGNEPLVHPLISPIYADLTGLSPLLVVTGGWEVFGAQNRLFVARAKQYGVRVEHLVGPGMLHAFPAFYGLSPLGRAALCAAAEYARAHTRSAARPPHEVFATSLALP